MYRNSKRGGKKNTMREAKRQRASKETDISVRLNLDGTGKADISTGIGFFDHMLTALAVHAGFDLTLSARGDLAVDCHHTVEDTGIVLGQALYDALGDKSGIARYGSFTVPMDESLAFCALDISGRPYLVFDCPFASAQIGAMDTAMVEEFFRSLAFHAGITLHIKLWYGVNDHHKCEAVFKACAHALRIAAKRAETALLSTKGMLD